MRQAFGSSRLTIDSPGDVEARAFAYGEGCLSSVRLT